MPVERKRTATFQLLSKEKRANRTPRAASISATAIASPMPAVVFSRLGCPAAVIGFDCTTHDWDDTVSNRGAIGQFGWYTNQDIVFPRVIRIAWTSLTSPTSKPSVKSVLIKPVEYVVGLKATAYHGLAQSTVDSDGQSLAIALSVFVTDVVDAVSQGARLCAHGLEFDAGLVDAELQRCGLVELRETWRQISREGYCTMNPDLGRWLQQNAGLDVGPEQDWTGRRKHLIGLVATMRALDLQVDEYEERAHDSRHHAVMCRQIYLELLRRASLY